jgi:hypothetical protein
MLIANFIQNTCHRRYVLDTLVETKKQLWRVTHINTISDPCLQKTGRVSKSLK